MNPFFGGLFQGLKLFFLNYSKVIFFTCLFYALWLLRFYLTNVDLELHSLNGRMIGSATLYAMSIDARVNVFYIGIAILISSFIFLYVLAFSLSILSKAVLHSIELKMLNYCSLAGILYLVFDLYDFKVENGLEFIYFLHKFLFGAYLVKLIFKNSLSISTYAFILTLALGLYFAVSDLALLGGSNRMPDFFLTSFVIAQSLLLFVHWRFRTKHLNEQTHFVLKLSYCAVPLMFLPVMSVLKDEIALVICGKGYPIQNSILIYTTMLILLCIWIWFRYKKIVKTSITSIPYTSASILAKRYFPIFIVSLIAFVHYHPFMHDVIEMSESANRYLPIMEYKNWGTVPLLEKLNSHLLSDLFFSGLYAFFNDFKGNELELYDFLYGAIIGLLYYHLVYFITRNGYVAIFTVIFYPFYAEILPDGHAFSVLSLFLVFALINKPPSLRNYMFFFSGLVFLLLWRIDIASACFPVIFFVLLLYAITGKSPRFNVPLLLKAFTIVASVCLIILTIICITKDIPLLTNAKSALNYFSSAQTYGYIYVGDGSQQTYTVHYFLFPVIAVITVLLLLYKFKSYNLSLNLRISFISMVFIAGYYFTNFQRGLVRHSLIEGNDLFVSSFVYFFLAGSPYIFLHKTSQLTKFLLFSSISFFTLINYKCPKPTNSHAIFESAVFKFADYTLPELKVNTPRCQITNQKSYQACIDFLNTHLKANETFIDFTNTPMLYYFTQKITPSYFYQNPICSHNDFLQNRFISDLNKYEVPYLVFSRWIDRENEIDGVPNCFRHYRMAEYFYTHYHPYISLENYCIWIKNDRKEINHSRQVYAFTHEKGDSISKENNRVISLPVTSGKNYLIQLKRIDNVNEPLLKTYFNTKELAIDFTTVDANSSVTYATLQPEGKELRIQITKPQNILDLIISECDYTPDYRSTKFMDYSILKLPYIWGTYDDAYRNEEVLFEDQEQRHVVINKPLKVSYPYNIDKSSGNTIEFQLKSTSNKKETLHLSFAGANQQPEGTVHFEVVPSEEQTHYAFRISSIYNWYKEKHNLFLISTDSESEINITSIKITKGK